MKSLIELLTTSDCQEIWCTSMPTGRSWISSPRRLSIAAPTSTMLEPSTPAMAIAMAGLPL